MIRVMLVDDHAAVRAGVHAVLAREPGLVPVAAVADETELWPVFHRTRPNVVLLDYHLPGQSSLLICRRLKSVVPAPRVVFYTAYAEDWLTVPLRIAGADGLVGKGAPATELFEVVRTVARGSTVLPPLMPVLHHAALSDLAQDDRAIAAVLLDGGTASDIAEVLGVDLAGARERIERLLRRFDRRAAASAAGVLSR